MHKQVYCDTRVTTHPTAIPVTDFTAPSTRSNLKGSAVLLWDGNTSRCPNTDIELPYIASKEERWAPNYQIGAKTQKCCYNKSPSSVRYFVDANNSRLKVEHNFWCHMAARHHRIPFYKETRGKLVCNHRDCFWSGRTINSAYSHCKSTHAIQLCIFRNLWIKIQRESWHKLTVVKAEDKCWPVCDCP